MSLHLSSFREFPIARWIILSVKCLIVSKVAPQSELRRGERSARFSPFEFRTRAELDFFLKLNNDIAVIEFKISYFST